MDWEIVGMAQGGWARPGAVRWGGHLHEPIYFYRGQHRRVGCVDGAAAWLGRWYRHVRSQAVLAELAAAGINTLYLNFFKGYGRRFEAAEMARTTRVVRRARSHGLRSILYIQPTNFFTEFQEEVPQAADWICRNASGREVLYGGQRGRPLACLNSDGWIEYVGRMAAEAAAAGADAILLDNINHNQCLCPRCREAFAREGSPGGDLLRRPPDDTVVRSWRCRRTEEVVARIAEQARQVKADIVLAANPAFPRDRDVMATGIDPQRMARLLDVFLLENKAWPRVVAKRAVHSSYAYHLVSAAGRLAAPSVWLPPLRLPRSPRQILQQTLEPVMLGGHAACSPWALRPIDDRRTTARQPAWKPLYRLNGLGDAWREALRFAEDAETALRNTRPWARLGVLHRSCWFAGNWSAALRRLLTIDAALHAAWLPYRFVLDDETCIPDEIDALLLPFGEQDSSHRLVRSAADRRIRILRWDGRDGELFPDPSVEPAPGALAAARRIAQDLPALRLFAPAEPAPTGVLHFVTQGPGGTDLWLLNLASRPVRLNIAVADELAGKALQAQACAGEAGMSVTYNAIRQQILTVANLDVAARMRFKA